MEKDYYSILGIDRTASRAQITRAYRRLAAKYHPDKHQGNPLADLAEEKFKEINDAYHALTGGEISLEFNRRSEEKKRDYEITRDAKEFLYEGLIFYNEGNYANAILNFEKALKSSKAPSLYNLLGLAYLEEGKFKKAVDPLVSATRLDEENGKYYFDAGYAFYRLKIWDTAIQYFLDAYDLLKEGKRLGAACIYIAICNYNIGKSARAEFFLEEAVTYDPENNSYRLLLEEFRQSQESNSSQRIKIINRISRFAFSSRLEESIGNIFKTMFSK